MLKKTLHFLPRYSLAFSFISLLLAGTLLLNSCTPAKNVAYFTDLSDSARVILPDLKRPEGVIMNDDILDIKIAGANEQTTLLFNNYGGAVSDKASTGPAGYVVDANGEIEFPMIGKVKAAGLTRDQLKVKLKLLVIKYLVDPVVTVRFTNFRFTVLGEVRNPGSFLLPTDRVTILDALGQAGDMTQYAKRNTVRIVRDSSGKREIGLVDFNQKTVFTSPYYYLQRNDVLYVEPQKSKTNYESAARLISLTGTVVSVVAVAFALFK